MTLSDTAEKTKKILKWAAIFLGAIFVILIALRIFSAVKEAFAPPPPPGVAFGKLPPPDFPITATSQNFFYTLDTISGKLPAFPSQIKVFKMSENQADLLALSKTQNIVGGAGFTNSPTKISENIYQWRNNQNLTLTMNIQDLNFNVISDFLQNPNQPLFNQNTQTAVDTARSFLGNMRLLPEDIDPTTIQTKLFSIKNYGLIPATSLSNTQVIQVSFFQKPFDNLPIYYPRVSISPINLLIGQAERGPQIVEANFFYQKPSSTFSTYPIKTAAKAFDDLKKGKAYIAIFTSSQNKISINNVSLGYYISEKKQNFLLPIIVFQGSDFTAYVTAIADEWVNK